MSWSPDNISELRDSHSYDPLGAIYDGLMKSELIQEISIGGIIAGEILRYLSYFESTLAPRYDCEYREYGYVSNLNDCEIAHNHSSIKIKS